MGWGSKIKKKVKKAFDKASDAVGKIFKPIVKGIDKLTGGAFSKIMSNKWVQGALLAVSVVTGGIAIANGVMAAGEAGIGAAAKAFAENMSMETGKNLLSTVVSGGKEFISGVAQGLADPLGSDAGQAMTGMFDSAVGSIAGTPATGADQLAEISSAGSSLSGETAAAALDAGSVAPLNIPGGTPSSAGMLSPSTGAANTFAMPAGAAPAVTPATGIQVPGMPQYSAISPGGASAGIDVTSFAGPSGSMIDPASASLPDDLLSRLAKGAKDIGGKVADYVTSPVGMYQAGTALQGWAQGQALQERWDEMNKREDDRYKSWTSGGAPMPRLTYGPIN
ncbi:MAG: hypothetical protein KDE03_17700 [Rhodobacteraceae bacterium]|nr:hypothetical protein [Paracoccaceae bacterium]